MKQRKVVSMIGALVLIISAVVLITGCSQPNSNKGNTGGGNSQKTLDGLVASEGSAATIIFLIIKSFGHGMMAEFSKRK